MPDIAMCTATGCPMEKQCYRKTAVPTPHSQCYSRFVYYPDIDSDRIVCDDFWPNDGFYSLAR